MVAWVTVNCRLNLFTFRRSVKIPPLHIFNGFHITVYNNSTVMYGLGHEEKDLLRIFIILHVHNNSDNVPKQNWSQIVDIKTKPIHSID